jgi:peptidoglycan/LPS O-acetylase OafA/YrhL
MVRTLIAVIVGYVVMALFVIASFSLAMLVLGPSMAFKPTTHDPSTLWLLTSFLLSFIGAVAGGWVCTTISKTWRAPLALAALILGLGLLLVVYVMMAPGVPRSPERERNVRDSSPMESGQQPIWVTVLNPVVAAGGIVLGARLKAGRKGLAGG